MNQNVKAWVSLALLAAAMALLLFVPAGTIRYWQAWLFLAIFIGASSLHTLYMTRHDPALLARRLGGGPTAEKEMAQKIIMLVLSVGFIVLLVGSGLDHRFRWSAVSPIVVVAGAVLIATGQYVIFLVFKENSFTSATVEVAKDQTVICSGPYAVVRHPMYAGALLYLVGIPLALGSYWALVTLAAMAPFLIWRLFDEERLLSNNLPEYAEYRAKVHSRLIPGIF